MCGRRYYKNNSFSRLSHKAYSPIRLVFCPSKQVRAMPKTAMGDKCGIQTGRHRLFLHGESGCTPYGTSGSSSCIRSNLLARCNPRSGRFGSLSVVCCTVRVPFLLSLAYRQNGPSRRQVLAVASSQSGSSSSAALGFGPNRGSRCARMEIPRMGQDGMLRGVRLHFLSAVTSLARKAPSFRAGM